MSCIGTQDLQLVRLADAIAQRVGPQRFHVWFHNSTKLDLKQEGLEITVPNDFISEWIGTHFKRPIQEAAQEVLGGPLRVRFHVMPEMFADSIASATVDAAGGATATAAAVFGGTPAMSNAPALMARPVAIAPTSAAAFGSAGPATAALPMPSARAALLMPPPGGHVRPAAPAEREPGATFSARPRLRHDLNTYIVGASNQLAFNAAKHVSEFPGSQYNPLFIHGNCGLGKTHLLQAICKRFIEFHPTKRWMYLTGEEFTNEFLTALRTNKLDVFRRKMRDLDLLVIDDVHFLGGKKATQEEFLHTFNAIEAMGRQVVLASDEHPKMIEELGESLINRFVSGMVVRVDPPNFSMRCDLLRALAGRTHLQLPEEVVGWIARRVTQNVRELEGAMTRVAAHVHISGRPADVQLAQEALGDLDRAMVTPVKPENILDAVCAYFGLEHKDLMSGRRQRTISLARSVAMFLVRKTAKLSFPEIGNRMGKRNHSTVISACRRIEKAVARNEVVAWTSAVGERTEEAAELVQRLEEHSRAIN